jgi:Ca2+-binding EF-hand superfamily protein
MRKNFAEYLAAAALAAAPVAAQESGDLFTKLDANKDGFVTPDEVQEGQKTLYERMLRTSDKDSDKKLSKEEFQAGLKPDEGPRPPLAGGQSPGPRGDKGKGDKGNPREFFERLDANKDGKLSKDEVPERMRDNVKGLDANNDGAISLEEFVQTGRFGKAPPGTPPPGGSGAAQRETFETLFDRTDSNSDGKLTKSEVPEDRQVMRAVLERAGGESIAKEQFVRGMMAAMAQGAGQPPRPEGAPRPEGGPRPDGAPRPEGARPDGPRPEGARPEGGPFRRPEGAPPFGPPGGGLFGALDADRNGELSTAEIVAAGTALLKLDRNNDGKLTPDEVFAGGPPGGMPGRPGDGRPGNGRPGEGRPGVGQPGNGLPGGPPEGRRPGQRGFGGQNPEELMQRLKAADTNTDGKLSKDEAPDFLKERFDRIDTNSDGFLDENEMRQMTRFMSQGGDQKTRRPKND